MACCPNEMLFMLLQVVQVVVLTDKCIPELHDGLLKTSSQQILIAGKPTLPQPGRSV